MEKEKEGKADNYDNVNMDMSDGSDNEMFACKQEYKAFKNQFSNKPKEKETLNEYGGAADEPAGVGQGLEYGGGGGNAEYGGKDANEYGSGEVNLGRNGGGKYGPSISTSGYAPPQGRGFQHGYGPQGGRGHGYGTHGGRGYGRFKQKSPSPTPVKIEKEPKLYKDEAEKEKEKNHSKSRERSREGRSKSKDRSRKTRSRSKERRRSRSRDHGKDKKRSRSRSRDKGRDRRDDHHRDRRDHDSRDRRDGRRDWDRDGGDWRRDHGRGRGRGGWERRGGGGSFRRDEQRRNVEEQMRKVEEMGVEMPKYYKAGAVNPVSYAEQVQKRKLLWKKSGTGEPEKEKESEKAKEKQEVLAKEASKATSFNKWEATNFGDESANEKFRRLMGIKAAPKPEELADLADAPGKNSEKLMTDLQRNYDVARQQTHRNRGIGLGFGEGGFPSAPPQVHGASYGNYGAPGYGAPVRPAPGHGAPVRPGATETQAAAEQQRPAPVSFGRGGYGIKFVKKE